LFVEKKEPEQIIKVHQKTASTFFNYPMSIGGITTAIKWILENLIG
jgi:hypothetical protein